METRQVEIESLSAQVETLQKEALNAENRLLRRTEVEAALSELRLSQSEAKVDNLLLKTQMEELKERINRLKAVEGAECPLCGQPLSSTERLDLLDKLQSEGREMGDRYRSNQGLMRKLEDDALAHQSQLEALIQVDDEFRRIAKSRAQLEGRLEVLLHTVSVWQEEGAPRLKEVEALLDSESFAPEARAKLARIDADLKAIGYDSAAHDALRQAEQASRESEVELRLLESVRAALAPLERELADLKVQIARLGEEVDSQEKQFIEAAALLAAAEAQTPDLEAAEKVCYQLTEQENRLRMEVGAAQQKVQVLEDLKERRRRLDARREELSAWITQYRQLERAFGKDGVPALLIEQALPQIEARSNEVLGRLSDGNMSVRFITQAAYKDKRREDLKETLDIQIRDGMGARDYEMFSGGEAFRVNFAIRLALSEVLAQRAGARLQTLVIDEGFGSQDNQGRQRLVEAINLVRDDFAKILVITHLDELKDYFPNRIEVEKTDAGSRVRVI
jgi:exonuclease SbcC